MLKTNGKKLGIGIGIFVVIIIAGVLISRLIGGASQKGDVIYGAVGGGKENFLADEEVNRILLEEYNLVVKNDAWIH